MPPKRRRALEARINAAESKLTAMKGERIVAQAIREGRIAEADAPKWRMRYAASPELTTAVLNDLAPDPERTLRSLHHDPEVNRLYAAQAAERFGLDPEEVI
jgi:hypothetical protein